MTKALLNFSYLALFAIWAAAYFIVIPVPVNLIVHSCLIIYIGSHRSLNLLTPESEGGAAAADREVLTAADAYKFPFIGSAALFSLYVVFKYFDKDTVNLVLSVYFSVIGVVTLTTSFSGLVAIFIPGTKRYGFKKVFPVVGTIDCLLTSAEIVCFLFSCVFAYYYFMTKHYMLNNILGISFCIQSVERISIGSYKIGAILLIGLFFYDIFWVFGTEVMVSSVHNIFTVAPNSFTCGFESTPCVCSHCYLSTIITPCNTPDRLQWRSRSMDPSNSSSLASYPPSKRMDNSLY